MELEARNPQISAVFLIFISACGSGHQEGTSLTSHFISRPLFIWFFFSFHQYNNYIFATYIHKSNFHLPVFFVKENLSLEKRKEER